MSESREKDTSPDAHDPHDPRGGRTNPTGPQGTEQQETWQKSKSGEAAIRDASAKTDTSSEPEVHEDH